MKIIFTLLVLFLLFSCDSSVAIDCIPKKYIGTWYETSDDIVLGYEKSDVIRISPNEITFSVYI
jgi:hypothetical protein